LPRTILWLACSLAFLTVTWTGHAAGIALTEVLTTFDHVARGSAAWGDYDNDNDLDLLITGVLRPTDPVDPLNPFKPPTLTPATRLYRNRGDGTFEPVQAELRDVDNSSAVWGDYDNDGDADLFTGAAAVRNDLNPPNSPPTAPGGLARVVEGSRVELSWSAATDAETPSAGLRYVVRVGTRPGAADVLSPAALPAHTNPGASRSWALRNLVEGRTYFWSVQAIDSAGQHGPFAPEAAFRAGAAIEIAANGPSFGFQAGQFGFSLAGSPGRTVVVERSQDLRAWSPVWTNTFAQGTLQFSDADPGMAAAFYRARTP